MIEITRAENTILSTLSLFRSVFCLTEPLLKKEINKEGREL